jgi:hypothetical protein
MSIPVIEVHLGDDGVWEAFERPVFGSNDVETVDTLDGLPTRVVLVRVGGALKPLTVYTIDEEDGWIVWDQAYAIAE